ncbi:MAG: DUF4838 domain-containing protein [Candidatus Omnitrophica bacterium]|nr:DUF4838 domain-containing protein [Candidatus Omnitrophota bacterium]
MKRTITAKLISMIFLYAMCCRAMGQNCPFIVRDGQSFSVIVVAANATAEELFAAEQLRSTLRRMTGVGIELRRDHEAAFDPQKLIISVGLTRYLTKALRQEMRIGEKLSSLDPWNDAFVIAKTPDVLFLAGHRDQGTIFAVFELMESLGCRWFFGNDAGIVIPTDMKTIEIEDCHIIKKPDFAIRRQYTWWDNHRDAADRESERFWHQANKLSEKTFSGDSGHNMGSIISPNLYDVHPEYFAMVNGQRVKPSSRANWQPCLSNPGVVRLAVEWAEKQLAQNPDLDVVTFAQNDGAGYCECPVCAAIGNHADVYLHFANQVGRELFPKYPRVRIQIWAYYKTAVVPHLKANGYDRDEDRVHVQVHEIYSQVPFDELLVGWSRATRHLGANIVWTWSNWRWGTNARPHSHRYSLEQFPLYKNCNVDALTLQARADWASNGVDRYLFAKRMWDADADLEELISDLVQKMFPSAVGEYFSLLDLYEARGKFEITPEKFLRSGFALLELMRTRIRTAQELKRWQFYILYFHQQVLEHSINTAQDKDEKIKLYREMVAFLKGIKDLGVLESNQLIRTPCWLQVKNLGGAVSDPSFPDVIAAEISDSTIEEIYKSQLFKILNKKFIFFKQCINHPQEFCGSGNNRFGIRFPLRPFFGVIISEVRTTSLYATTHNENNPSCMCIAPLGNLKRPFVITRLFDNRIQSTKPNKFLPAFKSSNIHNLAYKVNGALFTYTRNRCKYLSVKNSLSYLRNKISDIFKMHQKIIKCLYFHPQQFLINNKLMGN